MKYFLAVNDKQLGVCLRMLYADGIQGIVETVINSKNKIEFHVTASIDDERLDLLLERYDILIS